MRIRLRYTKLGKIRFIGHRDLARIWERAIRRAGLPVAYTQGFSPRPKMAFGLALATGFESDSEYLDVELMSDTVQGVPVDSLGDALTSALPDGMSVTAVAVLEGKHRSLQDAVTTCSWTVDLDASRDAATEWIDEVLGLARIDVIRERKGRQVEDDLRPQVVALELFESSPDEPTRITAELGTKPRALRPTELLASVEPTLRVARVRRTHQWISHDGDRYEPLLAVSAAQEVCAT